MTKRRIVVDGVEYRYVVGHSSLRVTYPDGTSKAFPFRDAFPGQDVGRGRRKGTSEGMITPADVEAFLRA